MTKSSEHCKIEKIKYNPSTFDLNMKLMSSPLPSLMVSSEPGRDATREKLSAPLGPGRSLEDAEAGLDFRAGTAVKTKSQDVYCHIHSYSMQLNYCLGFHKARKKYEKK